MTDLAASLEAATVAAMDRAIQAISDIRQSESDLRKSRDRKIKEEYNIRGDAFVDAIAAIRALIEKEKNDATLAS